MRNNSLAVATVVAISVALTACTANPTTPAPSEVLPSVSPTPHQTARETSAPPIASVEPSAPRETAGEHEVEPDPAAPLKDDAIDVAALAASTFLRAYGRADLSAKDWFAGIQGLLTPSSAEAYAYSDPATIPPFEISGDPLLVEGSTIQHARFDVATSTGTYRVILFRPAEKWLVDRAVPPGGVE
ncbi:hypothetical protein [Agromyces sp. Soil535]|uniref:hypothetical protein n=1 Tax=Agromyces sp. Soil535 TaxID=1736390 RepID=UPI0006F6C600|nr:hypothetical protein [Agromyces sp. Soil535]KRE28255.1 hypothetical protein ASG80_21490 [Agromyces sp. Soil535]